MRPVLALVLGIVLGILLVPTGIYLYFAFGKPPVAVADNAFPFEKQIVRTLLHARIAAEMPKEPAIPSPTRTWLPARPSTASSAPPAMA